MILFLNYSSGMDLPFRDFVLDSTMAPPAIWLDHIAFCRRHGFDHKLDLEPQFMKAFEEFGRDYEQIRGSVSFLYSFHTVSWGFR